MNVVVVLIVFSGLMTAVCAKARAAVPALIAGVFCTVLVCSLASGLPGAFADATGFVGDAGAQVARSAAE